MNAITTSIASADGTFSSQLMANRGLARRIGQDRRVEERRQRPFNGLGRSVRKSPKHGEQDAAGIERQVASKIKRLVGKLLEAVD
jgi:hypothetical protein